MTSQPRVGAASGVDTAPRTLRRIIGLDGVRGLACLAVAVTHISGHFSPQTAAAGKLGMLSFALIFFFALSGFLLFLPYARGLFAERSVAALPSTKNYLLHRFARVFPGYLAIFLLCNYLFQVVYVQNPTLQPPGTDAGTGMITDPGQLVANLTLLQTYVPGYFQTGLNPSWSLTLEFAFYASLPLLGMLSYTLLRRTRMRPVTLALLPPLILIAIGFVGKLAALIYLPHIEVADLVTLNWGPNATAVYFRSFLANADNFAFGMLAAVVVVLLEKRLIGESIARRIRMYSLIGLVPAVVLFGLALFIRGSQFETSAVALGSGLFILVIVAPLARGHDSALARVLDVAPLEFVGKISLSIYLWHYPVMLLLGRWGLMAGDTVGGLIRNLALGLAATLLIASVTYYLVERPAMDLTRRYRRRWA